MIYLKRLGVGLVMLACLAACFSVVGLVVALCVWYSLCAYILFAGLILGIAYTMGYEEFPN